MKRKWQYNGIASFDSDLLASLENVIPMGDPAPDIRVSDIMDIRSGILCYRY